MPFEHWNSKRTAAADPATQQSLLAEIGAWRARNLTDIPGQRDAAFALSKLHKALGNEADAIREARTLLSLCQTPPEANKGELAVARKTLTALGETAPRIVTPGAPRERRERRERTDDRSPRGSNTSGQDAAIEKALAGDFAAARRILKGKKGREAVRVWIDLCEAIAADGDRQSQLLNRLEGRLRQTIGLPAAPKRAVPEAPPAPPAPEDGALGQLIGRKLPRRREPFLRALAAWLADHADQADALASTALQYHIDTIGAGSAAPWLASFVARALASDGSATAAVIQSHEAEPIGAIFREAPFKRALSLVGNPRFSGLRRSVLGRNAEPDDRRAWTLRFDDGDKMIVLVPEHTEPYPADIATQLTERLPGLCSQFIVLAPGAANAPLRESLAGAGLVSLDGAPSDNELIAALDHVTPVERPARTRKERAPKEASAPRAAATPAAPAAPKIDPMDAVKALLGADGVPTLEQLRAVLEPLPKLRDAFLFASRTWFPLAADASARAAVLLDAADAEAPDGLRVPEATTLSLRIAAQQGGDVLTRLQNGPTAERFAGPGVVDVVGVVKGAADAGWELRRAFRGTTRRERRNQPMLNELGGGLDGLWRLGVEKGEERAEIWFVADLPIEGRAAVPQLLMDDRKRVVVLPVDPDLMSWFGTLEAPAAIGWMGEEGPAVGAALDALVG